MFLNRCNFKHEMKPTQSTAPFKEPQALFGTELKQIIKPRVKQELRSILMPVNIFRSIRHLSSIGHFVGDLHIIILGAGCRYFMQCEWNDRLS